MVMPEAFPQIEYVKPTKVQFRMNPDFMFGETNVSSLRKLLTSIEQILQQKMDIIEVKLFFDSWFYESTEAGSLQYVRVSRYFGRGGLSWRFPHHSLQIHRAWA